MRDLRSFLEEQGFTRIGLKKLITGHYEFSAKINNIKGNFILDTGASTSCIGFEDSLKFKMVEEASEIMAAGAGAINMKTLMSRNNHFVVGKKEFHTMDFILFDLSHVNQALIQTEAEAVNGIIGADFLKTHRAVIDYGRNCFYVK